MADFNSDLAKALVNRMLGIDEPTSVGLDEVILDKLMSNHSIPDPLCVDVRQALAMGYAAYLREGTFHELDAKLRDRFPAFAGKMPKKKMLHLPKRLITSSTTQAQLGPSSQVN